MFAEQNIPPTVSRIRAASEKVAMDWSLVLASQGIDTVIHAPDAANSWTLAVAAQDSQRAFSALRQYRKENQDWPWVQTLHLPPLRFNYAACVWALMLIFFYWLESTLPGAKEEAIMDSSRVFAGQWWRIFTAMTLHADMGHLATNLAIGIMLLGFAMGKFGAGTGLLLAYLAGAAGNLLSLLLNPKPFDGLGASGMVMGALGLLAAQTLSLKGWQGFRNNSLPAIAAGVMLFVLFGLSPGTDIFAHLGGFVTGWSLGTIALNAPGKNLQSWPINLVSGIVTAAVFILSWTLAFKHLKP